MRTPLQHPSVAWTTLYRPCSGCGLSWLPLVIFSDCSAVPKVHYVDLTFNDCHAPYPDLPDHVDCPQQTGETEREQVDREGGGGGRGHMELCLICIYIHNLGHCVMKYCMSRTCDTLIAHWIRYSKHPPREQHPVGSTRSHLSFDFSCVWSLLDLHKSLRLISVVYMGPTSLLPLPPVLHMVIGSLVFSFATT